MVELIVCDFDGTLVEQDVGDAICDRFADPAWREFGRDWREGRLTLPEAQRRMWQSVRVSETVLADYAAEVASFRAGADALFEGARLGRYRLVIASGGFEFYIRRILGERVRWVEAIFANRLQTGPSGARAHFPHERFAKSPYAVCKGAVIEHFGAAYFCGDGSSDGGAIGTDATLAAVRGSLFAQACNDAGRSCIRFVDFRALPFCAPSSP